MKITKNKLLNYITESFLYNRFKLMVLNQFEYEGLKDTGIEEKHVEKTLYERGYEAVVMDKELGLLCLPCSGIGAPNVYGEHVRYKVHGFGYCKEYKAKDIVVIENNKLRLPTDEAVLYFVNQLFDIRRTIDVNVKQLKLQTLFTANDKNVLTVKKILDEIDEYNHAVIVDSSLAIEDIVKAIPTGVKPLTTELTDLYHDVLNEGLTYFGINNANTDKRERLITDEVNSNNQFIDSCAQMFFESRKKGWDAVNEKFGTNVTVKLRNVQKEVTKNADKPITKDDTTK